MTTRNSYANSATEGQGSLGFVVLTVLIIVSLILNILSFYLLAGNTIKIGDLKEISIKNIFLSLEYGKVGGKENYDLLQRYSDLQLKEQIPQLKQYLENPNATTQTPSAPTGNLTADDLNSIKSDAVIEGKPDAEILVVEYSDMECPFCMKQYHETKLAEKLKEQYGDQLAFSFKNNRGVNHSGTEAKAIALLCVQKASGNEAYTAYYNAIMKDTTSNSVVFDVNKLGDLAKTQGVDMAVWQACYDGKETLSQFASQTAEANKYGLGGTPGTLIVNTKTLQYATVEGAYPYEQFVSTIAGLTASAQ